MKIGLIGAGRIGALRARILSGMGTVEALLVADVDASRAAQVVREVGADAALDPGDVLCRGVDAVVVAAATDAHAPLLQAAVAAGVPAFCEKPLAGSLTESLAVRDLVQASGVPVQIGFQHRFDPAFAAAHAAVASGEVGWLHTVRSTTFDPAPPPESYVAVSGGIFNDCAVHDFDIVRWTVRAQGGDPEVASVYATGSNRGEDFFTAHGDVDSASTLLTFTDGTVGVVSNSRYNPRGYDCRLEVHGSKDSVAAGHDNGMPLRPLDPGVAFPPGPPHTFFLDRFHAAYVAELATFLAVATGHAPSPCTVSDAVQASRLAHAATLSLRTRQPVSLKDLP